ncbi:alpha/beta hydrolase [Amycolatopsis rubida]|uniref:Alpha/beta hydrolase n=1 Tax=Amycolatopsis rubida TaxID=112413 RepID=A0ABX0BYP4_9PSEU|nr:MULTISPECIES: alpha/beta hydrolase [Amycolatopsis]MYW92954.1 alpha/beta fold hydrolase [Amycolatopsis rubida]NEC57941.1 alpha/beta hydrolase [Amycolatopsis rubida]OAP25478.1 Carboxylesterase NlhH [Amycolatopsis sp. M39]
MTKDTDRPSLRIRLYAALGKEPEWSRITAEELHTLRLRVNRKRASPLARIITGRMDPHATAEWREMALPGRTLPVRVYRPFPDRHDTAGALPLVLHVHGGGFVGTAAQSDWINSHLAARLPAVVMSVDHRLLAPGTPLADAVDDGWEALEHVCRAPEEWGVDPGRAAVFGESAGGLIAALVAIRARDAGLSLRAQVLANPCVDVASSMNDLPSYRRYAENPTLTTGQMEMFLRLALPPGTDASALSPLRAEDASGLPSALVVVPTHDPISDQGRRYAARLRESGSPVQVSEYPGATHAFLSMPNLVPQAKAARAEITAFLEQRLNT